MKARAWRRLAWAIALFALVGTPTVRAFCAATCDTSATHAGHAAPADAVDQAPADAHAHHHPPAAVDRPAAPDTRVSPAGPAACADLTAAAVAGPRAGAVTAPPAVPFADARTAASGPALRPDARIRPRPPGGAAAPLPLRI